MHVHHLAVVAATLSLLILAACGGGGSSRMTEINSGTETPGDGSTQEPGHGDGVAAAPPVREGGHAKAATSLPIAGSITQSSDSIGGVTANSVEASISLGSKGLLTADVRGVDWRISTEPAPEGRWHHVFRSSIPFADTPFSFVNIDQEQGGNMRQTFTLTDRALPPETTVAAGDVWVSSERYDSELRFRSDAGAGIPGTLNGEIGALFCCSYGDDSGPVIGSPRPEENTTNHIGSGQPYTLTQSDAAEGFTFIRQSDAQNPPQDTDYLILGFWLYVPAEWLDEGGDLIVGTLARAGSDIEYGAFANGSDPFEQGSIRALTGTATYTGSAIASYVDTSVDSVTGEGKEGFLLADAQLTANFSSASSNGAVSGNITNFFGPNSDPEHMDPSDLTSYPTELTLHSASIGGDHSGFFTGDTAMTFDGSSFAGKWGGQFYGNGETDGRPGSTAGTFGAATADGSKAITGVFGAYKQ